MIINCIAIDDEPLALQLINDYIEKTEGLHLLKSFTNPIEGLQFLDTTQVDLIFLDIQMPELSGLQFMKIINRKYPVILTTAYDEYALQGYEFDVIDYLLKPISIDRFLIAIQKVRERLKQRETTVSNPMESAGSIPPYIFVKTSYKTLKINLKDILYLEGLGDYVAIHTVAGKSLTLEKMKDFADSLPEKSFVRVHKSYIVSVEKIDFIEKNRIKLGETLIPIGSTYQEAFWKIVKKSR